MTHAGHRAYKKVDQRNRPCDLSTGIAASEWINRYVLIEAKWLLHHERGQSIQQIAYHLGFTEQASFSRFFKSYEGKTPKEYREQK